jgi:hypothetical protein
MQNSHHQRMHGAVHSVCFTTVAEMPKGPGDLLAAVTKVSACFGHNSSVCYRVHKGFNVQCPKLLGEIAKLFFFTPKILQLAYCVLGW